MGTWRTTFGKKKCVFPEISFCQIQYISHWHKNILYVMTHNFMKAIQLLEIWHLVNYIMLNLIVLHCLYSLYIINTQVCMNAWECAYSMSLCVWLDFFLTPVKKACAFWQCRNRKHAGRSNYEGSKHFSCTISFSTAKKRKRRGRVSWQKRREGSNRNVIYFFAMRRENKSNADEVGIYTT